jgi:hypothetical protein
MTNPMLWRKLWNVFCRWMFPSHYQSIKLYGPALDANLIGLDGETKYTLVKDFVEKTTIPLVINIGSYN